MGKKMKISVLNIHDMLIDVLGYKKVRLLGRAAFKYSIFCHQTPE